MNNLDDINARIISEIESLFLADDETTHSPEQLFTDYTLSLLADIGETANYRLVYDERTNKNGSQHKINAYAISENYETLDLFITKYTPNTTVENIGKIEAQKELDKLLRFFRTSIYDEYDKNLEESSEIFELVLLLSKSAEVKEYLTRINVYLITNNSVNANIDITRSIASFSIYPKIIDINYIGKLQSGQGIPLQIDLIDRGFEITAIGGANENEDYQTYLSVFPGKLLADVYEQFGSRLLEQNVRSFLAFTGKINKGIRNTILKEDHMFMAYNNGIAATAESIEFTKVGHDSTIIKSISEFQIVNGGQTTASIYYTWKKDRADLSNIDVPVKINIIKNKLAYSEIVSRIAEYANTQNKVNLSDLSSNKENHIILEKLSRAIPSPSSENTSIQTYWYYERTRGQYRNDLNRFGTTQARKRQFELQNPRSQVFNKEQLAKYINSFTEIQKNNKILIGPHIVVRGGQRSYIQFISDNFEKKPNSSYFKKVIALSIIYRTFEKIYGVKPNAIGDLRYVTVPYSISYISYVTKGKIDLKSIWDQQIISDDFKLLAHKTMTAVEDFIKKNSPGSLYGEYAKKEECWNLLKQTDLNIDFQNIICDHNNLLINDDINLEEIENNLLINRIKSIGIDGWKSIESWGSSGQLTRFQLDLCDRISIKIKKHASFSKIEIQRGNDILDTVLPFSTDIFKENLSIKQDLPTINIDDSLINKLILWDRKNRKLFPQVFIMLQDISNGKLKITDYKEKIENNLKYAMKHGFTP